MFAAQNDPFASGDVARAKSPVNVSLQSLLCPALIVEGHNALSPLSVCSVPDPKSRTEGRRKLKIGRKEACEMGDQSSLLSSSMKFLLCLLQERLAAGCNKRT